MEPKFERQIRVLSELNWDLKREIDRMQVNLDQEGNLLTSTYKEHIESQIQDKKIQMLDSAKAIHILAELELEIRDVHTQANAEIEEKYGKRYPTKNDNVGWRLIGRKEGLALVLNKLDDY